MRAHERKTRVLVLQKQLLPVFPAHGVVARLAFDAQFAAMNIRVAVGARRANVGEHQAFVAVCARFRRVRADERKAGTGMVKL